MKLWLIGKDPDAGKNWGQEEREVTEDEMLDSIIDSLVINLSKLREIVKDRGAWPAVVNGVAKNWIGLSD